MHRAPLAFAAVLLFALPGCTSGPRDAPGYAPSEHGIAVEGTVQAAAAVVAGIALPRAAPAATLHLEKGDSLAPWPVLVVADARAGGAAGTLFARGPVVRLEGPLEWTLASVALSAENLTGYLRTDAAGPRTGLPGSPPAGADLRRWQEHGDARFWSEALELRASGPVAVTAGSLVLATAEGLRDLGTTAAVEGGAWRAAGKVRTVEAPAPVTVGEAAGPRVQVALAEPRGTLALAGREPLALDQATVVDARAPDLRLAPGPGGVEVRIQAVAFQVYHGGAPHLRARVEVQPAGAEVPLREGGGSLRVRVREATGDADAVFAAVRTGGQGNLTMPGFLSVWDAWPPELRLLMLSGPWAVNFVFATVVMEGLRLLTGQYLPQPLQAGQEKEVTVGVAGATAGGEGWVELEGRNFDPARLTLRWR